MSTVTFTVHPIETAPKDRKIMAFHNAGNFSPEYIWVCAYWGVPIDGFHPAWLNALSGKRLIGKATHWAEPDDMRPTP